MPDLEISKLPELLGPDLANGDVLAIANVSASETEKITAKNLIQSGVTLIDNASIPWDKVDSPPLTVTSLDGSVIIDGTVTDEKIASLDGSKIIDGTITGDKFGDVVDRGLDITLDKIGITNSVVADSSAGISWNEQGLITGAVTPIPAADLPIATTTEIGAVSVPDDGGLAVSANGEISIAFTTTPNSVANITYNQFGQIVAVTPIAPGHLPIATDSEVGASKYPLSGGLLVDGDGNVTLSDTGVSAGQYTKVTVDQQGRVTAGGLIDATDIPPLSADQIGSGEFPTARLEDGSVTAPKLADYSTCLMQEDNPGAGDFLGQFWYTPSTAQLRVYSRGSGPQNIWLPVGFGSLQANNLRWGGTYDADTDKLGALTSIGVSAGLTSGDPFPVATDELSGMYFVCQAGGSNMAQPSLNGINHTTGDWALCLDATQGWVHIDVTQNNGGGGGATVLNDLLDVEIGGAASPFSTAPAVTLSGDQLLRYDGGAGLWRNTDIIDGGSID